MALPKIGNKFNNAIQKTDQEKKIAQLQKEVEELRAKQSPDLEEELIKLRENLQHQSGEMEVELGLIDPNLSQPRQTITPESIQAKVRLLKKHGQITSVILVPQGNGRYMLLDGQLRWEAAKVLEWETIRAVIVNPPDDLDQSSLITFLGFEDLNPLDKAEAIFAELVKETSLDLDLISRAIATIIKRIERDKKNKEFANLIGASTEEQLEGLESLGVTGEEQKIFSILLEFGLNPNSVKSNLLPMLSLPIDLKDAIRQHGLKGAHALALSRLSAKALDITEKKATLERTKLTQKVVFENLTVAETKQEIKKIKAKYLKSDNVVSKDIKNFVGKINKLSVDSLKVAPKSQLQELRELLEQKINQIDETLKA